MLAGPHGWSYEDLADGAGPFKNDLVSKRNLWPVLPYNGSEALRRGA